MSVWVTPPSLRGRVRETPGGAVARASAAGREGWGAIRCARRSWHAARFLGQFLFKQPRPFVYLMAACFAISVYKKNVLLGYRQQEDCDSELGNFYAKCSSVALTPTNYST